MIPLSATAATLKDVMVAARGESIGSINRLAWLRDHADNQVVQLSASVALLDRAWGRPNQSVAVSHNDTERSALDLSRYTSEELLILERLLAKGHTGLLVTRPFGEPD